MICAVIPTYNAADGLAALLPQLAPHVTRIVVADGGSTDGTLTMAIENGARIALGDAGRGGQLRRGASWARDCDWILFLHADSELPEAWPEKVSTFIKTHNDAAGYFDFKFKSGGWKAAILERLVRARCAVFALPYGDQGLLISRALYRSLGGYSDIPLFEDVEIVRKLGRARLKRIGIALTTSAAKYERDGFFRRGWRNVRLLRRYLGGESPDALARAYTAC